MFLIIPNITTTDDNDDGDHFNDYDDDIGNYCDTDDDLGGSSRGGGS